METIGCQCSPEEKSSHGEASPLQGPAQFPRGQMCPPPTLLAPAHLPPTSGGSRQGWHIGPWPRCGAHGPGAEAALGMAPLSRPGEACKVPFPLSCPESRPRGEPCRVRDKSHPGEAQALGGRRTRQTHALSLQKAWLGLLIQKPDWCPGGLAYK